MSQNQPEADKLREIWVCTRVRACKWSGERDEMKSIPSKAFKDLGFDSTDQVCPKCGNRKFFVSREPSRVIDQIKEGKA